MDQLPKIHVLIVGGGIGGLMLGLMLEKAGIDYQILERSPAHRPLGSAISLDGTVLRLFEQLGLLEDLYKISKAAGRLHLVKEDLETQGHLDLEHYRERYGYNGIVFGRPDLFRLLDSHIPQGKILMGKRVLSTSQTEDGVMIRCSDGSTYHGDVLVGADGAYSSVRQCMHKSLKEKGMLPKSDSEKLKFDQHCVVGITDELSPERFPILKEDPCEVYGIIGKKRPYTIWLIPIVGNRFAWSIGGGIPDSEVGQEDVRSFNFAEWWPEQASDVCDLVRDYALPDFKPYQRDERYKNANLGEDDVHDNHPMSETASLSDSSSCHSCVPSDASPSPIASSASSAYGNDPSGHKAALQLTSDRSQDASGTHSTSTIDPPQGASPGRKSTSAKPGTVGEILDATNPDRISKVMLESKLFKVWHHERTVLIGDACHKILPFGGQGAIQAIMDGIALANALYDIKSNSIESVTKAFKRYSSERFPIARSAVAGSQSFGKMLNVQGRLSNFIRKISFSKVPDWILKIATDKLHLHRPQLTYLPMVPDRGSAKAHKQEYSPRYLARLIQDQRQKDTHNRAVNSSTAASASTLTGGQGDKHGIHRQHGRQHQEPERRNRRHSHSHSHSHGHHDYDHRYHLSSLSRDSSSSRKSTRTGIPPPLPLEAPPRHHPLVHLQQLEEKLGGIPTPAHTSSAASSPSSSSYSLVNGVGSDDAQAYMHPRARRHTVNQNSRSQPTSPRVLSREMSLPPFLYETHHHRLPALPHEAAGHIGSSHNRSHGGSSEFLPQFFTPPRSPSTGTPPISPTIRSAPIKTHYREMHNRAQSMADPSLADTIAALEHTTNMMKERFGLREQRSLDQLTHSVRDQQPRQQQQQQQQ